MSNRVFVVGVGMTKFEKPGSRDWDYPDMAKIAIGKALADASLPYEAVEQACVGYVYGDSTCGQRALYTVGLSGIPVYNVNNNCSTGSTAIYMAKQFIQGGVSDCVLAFGFEKMEKGSLGSKFTDRTNPMDQHMTAMMEGHGFERGPPAAQLFGNAGREHMKRYGTKLSHFAKIAEKNHRHSANNPYSQFRDIYTLEQIMNSPKVHEPLTKLQTVPQCCPTSDGAGAAILCSERFVYKYGLQNTAVEIVGMAMATDKKSSFGDNMMDTVGYDMTKRATQQVEEQSGVSVQDVQVVELHDCFSANELITYEALGLCKEGEAGAFIDRGDNTYGGKFVINPSGGLISKGHPLGATGLAQCAEMCWQLRGLAEKRQVDNVKYALQHNLGLGGAAVVTMYTRAKLRSGGNTVRSTSTSRAESLGQAPVAVAAPIPAPAAAEEKVSSSSPGGFAAEAVFAEMGAQLQAAPKELISKINCTYRFDLKSGQSKKSWIVDCKSFPASVVEGSKKCDCMIAISDKDFVLLMAGKLNPMQAYMKGKLKITGNMMLAQKLDLLKQAKPAL